MAGLSLWELNRRLANLANQCMLRLCMGLKLHPRDARQGHKLDNIDIPSHRPIFYASDSSNEFVVEGDKTIRVAEGQGAGSRSRRIPYGLPAVLRIISHPLGEARHAAPGGRRQGQCGLPPVSSLQALALFPLPSIAVDGPYPPARSHTLHPFGGWAHTNGNRAPKQ